MAIPETGMFAVLRRNPDHSWPLTRVWARLAFDDARFSFARFGAQECSEGVFLRSIFLVDFRGVVPSIGRASFSCAEFTDPQLRACFLSRVGHEGTREGGQVGGQAGETVSGMRIRLS